MQLDPNGDVSVLIGTQSSGQGHQTAYAQLVAEQFGLPPERVHVFQGDTDMIATGLGTGGSSSIPTGGVSVERATRELGNNLREIAAEALEASRGDLEINEGTIRVAGTDRSISFADLAKRPGVDPSKLNASATFTAADGTFPNGTHLAEVEIDPATGFIRIVNYVIVDDFGVTLNPLLLAGQVHGGAMQGIGQALMEEAVYSASDGQLQTGTFMDYALPRAADGPSFVFETHNVPCTTNPLGVKGAGEAGAIGSCPGGRQCHHRRALARVQDRSHRHAGDAGAGLDRDPRASAPAQSVMVCAKEVVGNEAPLAVLGSSAGFIKCSTKHKGSNG